jgi:CDP-diacylglycerol--glycerol-3-phosphate 3-phosphatidyltransferase
MTKPQPATLNVPNALTMARLVLAIAVFVLMVFKLFIPALVVFVIAASTDWIDGYWARKFDQVTQFGRIFDPFVDKFIICGVFILLAAEEFSGVFGWMAVVIVARELLVTALRAYIEEQGGDFSAKMAGKLKMVFQCVAAGASLLALNYSYYGEPEGVYRYPDVFWFGAWSEPGWLYGLLIGSVWLSVISTVQSGLGYVMAASKILRGNPTDNDA